MAELGRHRIYTNMKDRLMRSDILNREEDIRKWINENRTKVWIRKQLNCQSSTLNKYLVLLDIKYEGNKGRKGMDHNEVASAYKYLGTDRAVTSYKLKNKLFREGLKDKICERCNLSSWMGTDIPLELHHIDENHYNNSIDNLQILCCNCHKQVSTNFRKHFS
jgi:hypothetical protein